MGYNSKQLKAEPLERIKKNPYKDDVIYDPRGQWDHPGSITKIPGNRITMSNVPYPVLGIDNLGNQQMMQPGMEYIFPGATSVTEYPKVKGWLDTLPEEKKGGSIKGLSKFTSKNIKTSVNKLMLRNETLFGDRGKKIYHPDAKGWLDKYK